MLAVGRAATAAVLRSISIRDVVLEESPVGWNGENEVAEEKSV